MANNYKDLSTSTILTAPSPATSGTSLVVQSGHGARFPATNFYATLHPDNTFPTLDNAEIVLVTAVSTDTFTITRAQKGTSAMSVAIGWRISASVYALELGGIALCSASYEFTRTAPSNSGDTVAIGSMIANGYGGYVVAVQIADNTSGFIQASSYIIGVSYGNGLWYEALPLASSSYSLSTQVALDVAPSTGTLNLRLRSTTGGTGDTMRISMQVYCAGSFSFTPATTTGTGATVSDTYPMFGKLDATDNAKLRSKLQVGATPTAMYGGYSPTAAYESIHGTANEANTTGQVLFAIFREGASGVSYEGVAEFALGRYDASGTSTKARLDINVTGAQNGGTPNHAMSIYGDGRASIGTSTGNANAILDLTSTTKPFMPPRMTTTQRDAVASPTAGMMIYNTSTNKLNVYTTAWEAITSA